MSLAVRFVNVSRRFGSVRAVDCVTLDIVEGEFFAMLGPSGSGKTTCLRLIAGFEQPNEGHIEIFGETAEGVPPYKRNVNTVFQDYALFPHMTVGENVAYGLMIKGVCRADREAKAKDALAMVKLGGYEGRRTAQLSGGQRQRVALARSLAVEPKLLLLDEPFGALDAKVRKELRRWLRRLHDDIHITSVFVTHDQDEALEVADRVVVMNEGVIEQVGTPEEVYDHPATPFVYSFLGDVNLFHGRLESGRVRIGDHEVEAPEWSEAPDGAALAYVRTHEVDLAPASDERPAMGAIVRRVRRLGSVVRLELDREEDGKVIEAELTRSRHEELGVVKGDRVFVSPRRARVFLEPD